MTPKQRKAFEKLSFVEMQNAFYKSVKECKEIIKELKAKSPVNNINTPNDGKTTQ